MIEIEELDHVLALARDRLDAGRKDEAADYLDQLIGSFKTVPEWVWPEARRAQRDMMSGASVDWQSTRDEFLLAINSTIVRTLNRHEAEHKGLLNQNADRKDRAEHRREEIRQVYKRGMSAGDVVNALKRANFGEYKRSTIEKDLQKIRGRVR